MTLSLIDIAPLVELASRIIWFESPEQALRDPNRFVAYAMRYASHEDMVTIRKYISDGDFTLALDQIPPGILDGRSWAYWNAVFNRYPAPPMPLRRIV